MESIDETIEALPFKRVKYLLVTVRTKVTILLDQSQLN